MLQKAPLGVSTTYKVLSRRGQQLMTTAAVGALLTYTLFRFRDALLTFYFLDDFWVMRDASLVQLNSIWDIQQFFWFGQSGFRLYRPLTTTAYSYLLQSLFGFDSSGQHAFQLVIFAVNVLLVVAIVRRMTDSATAGLSAGLLYLLAPGQAVNAYWLAAFTVSGTTVWILLMLWCWQKLRGLARITVCTLVQVCGLLASEHAIAAPVLCVMVAFVAREPWRRTALAVAPSAALVAAYVMCKLLYLPTNPGVMGVYKVTFDPVWILQQLGQYVGACFNVLALQQVGATISLAIGIAVIFLLALSSWAAFRGSDAARLVAAGLAMFGVSLAPVLVLPSHYFDHYICTAALGAVVVVVGCAQLLTRHWQWTVLGLSLALLVLDLSNGEKAWRENETFRLVAQGSVNSAAWVDAVQRVVAEKRKPFEVLIPNNKTTKSMFKNGEVQRFFPGMPARVTLYNPDQMLTPGPNEVVVNSASSIQFGDPLPFWDANWEWLRWLAGADPV